MGLTRVFFCSFPLSLICYGDKILNSKEKSGDLFFLRSCNHILSSHTASKWKKRENLYV